MIVYNVQRRWFAQKADADAYRRQLGHKPASTVKVTVDSRDDLSALLNALCEPTIAVAPIEPAVISRAYVSPTVSVPDCIPRFLLDAEGQKRWDDDNVSSDGAVDEYGAS